MKQSDLFHPMLGRHLSHQAELFERSSEVADDCTECGRSLVETPSGYWTCPAGCGKLLEPKEFNP